MKEVAIEKTIKESRYEAMDGTQFINREECKKYEESARCMLLTKYKPLVINTLSEYDINNCGSEEYMLDIVKITRKEDIDIIMQLYALYNSHYSYRQYDAKYRDMCTKALVENDYIFIARESCDDDIFCIQYSRNELIANLNSICNGQTSN